MIASRIALVMALALVGTAAYAGDEEVVTTSHAASSLPVVTSSDSSSSSSASDGQTQTLYAKPQGYESNGRTIHGGGGASVGTGGYRSGYVYTLIPVGEEGTLGLAYSQTEFGKGNTYGWGNGYRSRGGTATSASIMLDLSGSHNGHTDKGCAPGFSDGNREIEPVWVTKMRGNRDCKSDKDDSQDEASQ